MAHKSHRSPPDSSAPVTSSKSWKQGVVTTAKPFLRPFKDLLLSWMAYLLLTTFLTWAIGDIVWLIYAHGWDDHDVNVFYTQRLNSRNTMFQTLYVLRILLRWRRHLPCILHWLSPWSAEQHASCLLCSHTKPAEPVARKEQQGDWCGGQRGVGLFL